MPSTRLVPPLLLLRPAALRPPPVLAVRPRQQRLRALATTAPRLATQGHGGGTPAGLRAPRQAATPAEPGEHPGPAAARAAGGGRSEESAPGRARSYATSSKKKKEEKDLPGGEHPQPKILHDDPPAGEEQPEDVKRHNEELERMPERAKMRVDNEDAEKDKVPAGFWSGR
ncbi:hypothetical protein BDY21DRAFT_285259 [Lineolata rhizophorae]|uniref:Uncharacterized protein n=1 Tax=Lineolata rhizophorae TaxID=578093 RepID=A0A6A6P2B1_9PEZI|nr:hypothetical protein BDY21DRAFT_285259 [Lineolata rhizophorae]